jgi:hypothetical protein
MPITINGSGTVTGISVGGIPDGVVDTDVLAANAVTTAKLGSAEASGLTKAWVNFNGTGTVAIRASYNVSSITDNGVGIYTVNFTTALADANYAYVGFARGNGIAQNILVDYHAAPTTAALPLRVVGSGTVYDSDIVNITIFR